MGTQLQNIQEARTFLESYKGQFAEALPAVLKPERLMRVALNALNTNPKLLACDKKSLILSLMQAAQLGLEPDGLLGLGYLIPYGTKATFIPGYKGLIDLAMRSGKVRAIEARIVHSNDKFKLVMGLDPVLEHQPEFLGEQGDVVGAYAIARMSDGSTQFEFMGLQALEAIRKRSRAGNDGPWITDREEMQKKTVIRRLVKYLSLSPEVNRAVSLDERNDAGLPAEDVEFDVLDAQEDAKDASESPGVSRSMSKAVGMKKEKELTPEASNELDAELAKAEEQARIRFGSDGQGTMS